MHEFVSSEGGVKVGDGPRLEHEQLAVDKAPLDVARVAVVGGDLQGNEVIQCLQIVQTYIEGNVAQSDEVLV